MNNLGKTFAKVLFGMVCVVTGAVFAGTIITQNIKNNHDIAMIELAKNKEIALEQQKNENRKNEQEFISKLFAKYESKLSGDNISALVSASYARDIYNTYIFNEQSKQKEVVQEQPKPQQELSEDMLNAMILEQLLTGTKK